MSLSESYDDVNAIVKQAATHVQQRIPQEGMRWVQQQIPVEAVPIQRVPFTAGTDALPTCELCLTKYVVYMWIVIIFICSIIIWHLFVMLVKWLKDMCNRPRQHQQGNIQHNNARGYEGGRYEVSRGYNERQNDGYHGSSNQGQSQQRRAYND